MGRARPGGGAAPGAPGAAGEPGARGEAAPLPGAAGVSPPALPPTPASPTLGRTELPPAGMDKCQSSVYRPGQDSVPQCTLRAKKAKESPDGAPPALRRLPSGTPGPRAAEGGHRWPRRRGPPSSDPTTWDSCRGRSIPSLPLSDSTSLVCKPSEEGIYFSKGIWFRACVIKSEFTPFLYPSSSSIPFFFFLLPL